MPSTPRAEPSSLASALGRIPSGLFILTVRSKGRATGMLASWVQQAGFEPPTLTVALGRDRSAGDWVAGSGKFAISQIAAQDRRLLRHFARGFGPDEAAFDALEILDDLAEGGPVLADALAYLDCAVIGELEGPDHRVVLARVVAGALLHPEAEPMLHLRRNGLHY